jgi:hypothetical protein
VTTFDPQAIVDALASHAASLGAFERVNEHEPESPPGLGLTAAVWADYLGPAPSGSGLSATTGLLIMNVRAYSSMNAEPADAIDPNLLRAVWALMAAYSGDFTLGIVDAAGDPAAWIDLLGQTRSRLEARAGYLNQDAHTYRVMTLTVPIVIVDLWTQAP